MALSSRLGPDAAHEACLDRQLGRGERQGLARHLDGHAVELEQHAARLDAAHPELRRALARAHADLGGLLGHRHVGEDADPHAAGALHVARDGPAGGLDLAGAQAVGLHRLQAEGAKVEVEAALGRAADAALEGLAVLGALGLQHGLLRVPLLGALHARRRALRCRLLGALVVRHGVVRHDLALEHPDLDPAGAEGGEGRGGAVVDVGAQRVQRHAALAVPFHAGDFRAAQAARAVDADALGAEPHGRLHGALHGAAEGDAALELLGDVLGDQRGVDLGLADLDDVQRHLALGHLGEVGAQLLDVGALLADHHARTGGMDGDAGALGRTFDDDLGHARLGQPLAQHLADVDVLMEHLGIFAALGVPAGIPGPVDAEPEADGIDLLTHYLSSASARSRTTMVRWLNGFLMPAARPRPRVWKRFMTRPLPTDASATIRRSTSRLWLFSALAMAEFSTLRTSWAMRFLEKVSSLTAEAAFLPRIVAATRSSLRGLTRMVRNTALASLSAWRRVLDGLLIAGYSFATFLSPEWPWKVRVGENSPSLWPTISSVTLTGMNFLPL